MCPTELPNLAPFADFAATDPGPRLAAVAIEAFLIELYSYVLGC